MFAVSSFFSLRKYVNSVRRLFRFAFVVVVVVVDVVVAIVSVVTVAYI